MAVEQDLAPLILPSHDLTSYTVSMPPALAERILQAADQAKMSPTDYTAGLIAAAQSGKPDSKAEVIESAPALLAGETRVREILRPLMRKAREEMSGGKVVFMEAATGTGKGRMISALAADASKNGKRVVISAPLAVTWQLLEDLAAIPEANHAGIRLVLGRPNFISPAAALEWAQDNDAKDLIEWINGGGKPISAKAHSASKINGSPLCWLMEDAMSLAEDLPVSSVMLHKVEDGDACEAEQQYLSLRKGRPEASIVLCSHFMLASHFRTQQILSGREESEGATDTTDEDSIGPLGIPSKIDTLLIDEAHLLESAVASINTNSIHLRSLQRFIKNEVTMGKKPALEAIAALDETCKRLIKQNEGKPFTGMGTDEPELASALKTAGAALSGIKQKKLAAGSRSILNVAIKACTSSAKAGMRLQVDLSPVKNYPSLMVGRSNLQSSMEFMWEQCGSAALISATLYSDGSNSKLIRWKLSVPTARAVYLPSVHPDWVKAPVILHRDRTVTKPGNSDEWADEAAAIITKAATDAKGGTMVLCTSYRNAASLGERLAPKFGTRLILQTASNNTASCVSQYRDMYKAGIYPIWLGTGAAWTGIDLTDHEAEPADDSMLTNLVVTRLPVGLNRSLTHERRVQIAGFGISAQEGCWQLRQGIGRLVRREGVKNRNLWVIDPRLDSKLPWVASFLRVLSYRTAQ